MNSRVSLARHIQEHGFEGVSYGLATLPERENAHGKGAAEEPKDADHDPAWGIRLVRPSLSNLDEEDGEQ